MTYIIAEVGGNHEGSLDLAKQLIHQAKEAGCDAVKFQTYHAEDLVHPNAKALPQAKGYAKQVDRFKALQFTDEQWQDIIDECEIDFLTSCFDLESLDKFKDKMKYIKIASGDLTYHRLLRAASETGKPVLLSTGMSSIEEIKEASHFFSPNMLTVLHCVSLYPCPDHNANLTVIQELQGLFSSVGYSDHTQGITASLAACAFGLDVLEKHFTYDSSLDYGDHSLSLEFDDMCALVENVRRIKQMLGNQKPDPQEDRYTMRRGAYAKHDIELGQVISENDILAIRPQGARKPHDVIGKRSHKSYKRLDQIG